jgi:hypothetical protein
MFYFYSGSEPLQVLVPGEQYAVTIEPSERSQKTTNEEMYKYIFSDEYKADFPDKAAMLEKATSFEPPKSAPEPAPQAPELKEKKPEAKSKGGSE